jgi:hypothetical protein
MKTKASKRPQGTSRKRKTSDKDQFERFRQAARELETDESEEAFDRAIRRIVRVTKTSK